jgi:SSS family solute:Na+ symporter
LLSLFWVGMTRNGALASMLSGALTVLLWIYGPFSINGEPLSAIVYEIIPGFIVATTAAVLVSKYDKAPSSEIKSRHHRISALVASSGN